MGRKSKIDRGFVNLKWFDSAEWFLRALPRKNFDHRGLLFHPVETTLKSVRVKIKEWNLEVNGNTFRELEEAKESLANLEDANVMGDDLLRAKMEVDELTFKRDSILKQKSRLSWLKEGDTNTKFFHQSLLRRTSKNGIKVLQWNNNLLSKPEDINDVILSHFKGLFSRKENCNLFNREKVICSKLSVADSLTLKRSIAEEEVDLALNQCHSDKAPGPDGINAGVLKALWGSLRGEMLKFMNSFMDDGNITKGMNSFFITLIPKVKMYSGFKGITTLFTDSLTLVESFNKMRSGMPSNLIISTPAEWLELLGDSNFKLVHMSREDILGADDLAKKG
ncbi:hypothetical protein POM88_008105 [Heracleum sosnowskyi]|uniref:Reverse transcriptase n=1 Tax=Heracleum sosnowskyi TaxID=360622 RepID=A0AAD8J5S7_9APIA|nr:hypothetical protein POM88_008105 [Heracleum sosnowskyi]